MNHIQIKNIPGLVGERVIIQPLIGQHAADKHEAKQHAFVYWR